MAITDYKITDGEITQRNVKSAPDVLSDTPNNNKAVFDNLTEHFIGKYNDLIDNIDTDFVDSSEFAEGLTVSDKVRWRYALTKGTSIGLNFSGNITQITTGFRTIVGDIDNLTETDFMDCYLSINGEDYECGDSYASGNSILTSAEINGVTVEIIYDTTNGNITLEHATNPLDTLYWNVSIYRSVAEKVPRKALPADISNDGYTELSDEIGDLSNRTNKIEAQCSTSLYNDVPYITGGTTIITSGKTYLSNGAVLWKGNFDGIKHLLPRMDKTAITVSELKQIDVVTHSTYSERWTHNKYGLALFVDTTDGNIYRQKSGGADQLTGTGAEDKSWTSPYAYLETTEFTGAAGGVKRFIGKIRFSTDVDAGTFKIEWLFGGVTGRNTTQVTTNVFTGEATAVDTTTDGIYIADVQVLSTTHV